MDMCVRCICGAVDVFGDDMLKIYVVYALLSNAIFEMQGILKNIKKLVIDYKKDIMILGIIATRKGVKILILNLNAIKTL